MRDYGKVFSRIWESADFRAMTEDGRMLAMYLLTCQHGTIAGVFRVPDGYASEDLQWQSERVAEGFRNLEANGFATRCEATKWVWVTKFLTWNEPENPNQRKAVAKIVGMVPATCSWRAAFTRKNGPALGIDPEEDPKPLPKGSTTVAESGTGVVAGAEEGTEHSGAKAPGATAPVIDPEPPILPPPPPPPPPATQDPKDVVFALGVPLLTAAGVKESNGRSFLAMQCKAHGDAQVAAALEACAIEKPIQPIPWLQQRLKPAASRVGRHTGFESKNYREGVTADGSLA